MLVTPANRAEAMRKSTTHAGRVVVASPGALRFDQNRSTCAMEFLASRNQSGAVRYFPFVDHLSSIPRMYLSREVAIPLQWGQDTPWSFLWIRASQLRVRPRPNRKRTTDLENRILKKEICKPASGRAASGQISRKFSNRHNYSIRGHNTQSAEAGTHSEIS